MQNLWLKCVYNSPNTMQIKQRKGSKTCVTERIYPLIGGGFFGQTYFVKQYPRTEIRPCIFLRYSLINQSNVFCVLGTLGNAMFFWELCIILKWKIILEGADIFSSSHWSFKSENEIEIYGFWFQGGEIATSLCKMRKDSTQNCQICWLWLISFQSLVLGHLMNLKSLLQKKKDGWF